jgi:hypothetical protein
MIYRYYYGLLHPWPRPALQVARRCSCGYRIRLPIPSLGFGTEARIHCECKNQLLLISIGV